ncbi:hypothetical protein QBC39DRAFT_337061 [Podospora conica]|nr:hypothetical protein QBC39DRAFT_337061 [Schizothecium conicum]
MCSKFCVFFSQLGVLETRAEINRQLGCCCMPSVLSSRRDGRDGMDGGGKVAMMIPSSSFQEILSDDLINAAWWDRVGGSLHSQAVAKRRRWVVFFEMQLFRSDFSPLPFRSSVVSRERGERKSMCSCMGKCVGRMGWQHLWPRRTLIARGEQVHGHRFCGPMDVQVDSSRLCLLLSKPWGWMLGGFGDSRWDQCCCAAVCV